LSSNRLTNEDGVKLLATITKLFWGQAINPREAKLVGLAKKLKIKEKLQAASHKQQAA